MAQFIACGACFEPLRGTPEGDQGRDYHAVALSCGHLLHKFCLTSFFQAIESINAESLPRERSDPRRCPVCRHGVPLNSEVPLYLDVRDDDEVDEITAKMAKLTLQNERLQEEVKGLTELVNAQGTVIEGLNNVFADLPQDPLLGYPRVRNGIMVNIDSKCMNCESPEHGTLDCTNNCFLRISGVTPGTRFASPEEITSLTEIRGEAGEVLRDFLQRIEWNVNELTRNEVQTIFAFIHFGKFCWTCASPYHANDGSISCPIPFDPRVPEDRLRKLRRKIYAANGLH